jgi:cell division protein FtsL
MSTAYQDEIAANPSTTTTFPSSTPIRKAKPRGRTSEREVIKPETKTKKKVQTRGMERLHQLYLFATLVAFSAFGTAVAGHVRLKDAQDRASAATERASRAQSEVARLESEVGDLQKPEKIDAWAISQGFVRGSLEHQAANPSLKVSVPAEGKNRVTRN